jgi:hypothetical protein
MCSAAYSITEIDGYALTGEEDRKTPTDEQICNAPKKISEIAKAKSPEHHQSKSIYNLSL